MFLFLCVGRHRTKNKTTKMVVYISGVKSPTKNIFLWGPINHPQNFAILRGPILVGLFSSDTGPNKKHAKRRAFYFWWPWSDSNRHSLQNLILSQARLPIPPRGQKATQQIILLPLCGIQPFSPSGHCDSLCVPVSLPVFRVPRFFC